MRAPDSTTSLLVNTGRLAEIARGIELGEFLRLGVGRKSGRRNRASNLANALEAVVGAIYLDGGFLEAKRVVAVLLRGTGAIGVHPLKDARSRLKNGRKQAPVPFPASP